jgi:mono/diheme cytochrome c family protein
MKNLAIFSAGVLIFAACGKEEEKTVSANNSDCSSTLTYEANIKSIVSANCVGCHGASSGNGDLSSLSAIQARKSDAASRVASGNMPQGNSSFKSSTDGQNLLTWLNCSTLK